MRKEIGRRDSIARGGKGSSLSQPGECEVSNRVREVRVDKPDGSTFLLEVKFHGRLA